MKSRLLLMFSYFERTSSASGMELDGATWNDLSDREKLEWLRAKLLQVESTLGALARHVEEIGNIVKEIEFSGVVKAIEKKQKRQQ